MADVWEEIRRRIEPEAVADHARLRGALKPYWQSLAEPWRPVIRCSGLYWGARHWYFYLAQAAQDTLTYAEERDRVLDYGTERHQRIQAALQWLRDHPEAGDPYHIRVEAVEGYADLGRTRTFYRSVVLSGHVDALLTVDGQPFVLEFKTMRSWWWKSMTQPLLQHQWQATGYWLLFRRPTLFLYENKDTEAWKSFRFVPDMQWERRVREKLKAVATALRTQTPPPFCPQDPEAEFSWIVGACKDCVFQTVCGEAGHGG